MAGNDEFLLQKRVWIGDDDAQFGDIFWILCALREPVDETKNCTAKKLLMTVGHNSYGATESDWSHKMDDFIG